MKNKIIWMVVVVLIIAASIYGYKNNGEKQTIKIEPINQENPGVTASRIQYGKSEFFRESNTVFYGESRIPEADANSFRPLSFDVGVDKNNVFQRYNIQEGVDPATLQLVSQPFWQDKNGYYYFSGREKFEKLPFNPNITKSIPDMPEYYASDKEVFYFIDSNITKVEGADPVTFHKMGTCEGGELFSSDFVGDKNHVYAWGKVVPEADPLTLKIIAQYSPTSGMGYTGSFSKDKDTAFANCGIVIKGADVATFEYAGNETARDKNWTYKVEGSKIISSKR